MGNRARISGGTDPLPSLRKKNPLGLNVPSCLKQHDYCCKFRVPVMENGRPLLRKKSPLIFLGLGLSKISLCPSNGNSRRSPFYMLSKPSLPQKLSEYFGYNYKSSICIMAPRDTTTFQRLVSHHPCKKSRLRVQQFSIMLIAPTGVR